MIMRKEVIRQMRAFRIFFRSIRDALKSVVRNFSLSFASIMCTTITLILVAVAVVAAANVNNATRLIEDELTIVTYLKKDVTEEQIENIKSEISSYKNVEEVTFKSKDEWKLEMSEYDDSFKTVLDYLDENPLMDSFVLKVNDKKQLIKGYSALLNKFPNDPVIIEEYLSEPQYLVEAVVVAGKVHIIAIFKQDIQQQKRFIVTGYNLMLNPNYEFHRKIKSAVLGIIKLHGLTNGPCHLELRQKNDKWKLIEINPRISGAGMNRMILGGYGINLVEETLKMALGIKPDFTKKFRKHIYSQYVTVEEQGILERVTGKNRAKRSQGVLYVYVKPRKGTYLYPPLSMGHRYAYVIATGDSEEEAIRNSKNAASAIQFSLLPIDEEDENTLIREVDAYNLDEQEKDNS